MRFSKPAAWAGALCVFLSGLSSGLSAVMQDPPEVLTKVIRSQVDEQFPDWTLVASPACATPGGPAAADIDFDQSTDVALVATTPAGEPRVLIAMPRVIGGAIVHDLGPLSEIPGATHVVVLPQGRVVRAAGAMFDDYLSGPTFAAASCERPLMAFVWNGYGFRRVEVR
jgi:hypothetical protein